MHNWKGEDGKDRKKETNGKEGGEEMESNNEPVIFQNFSLISF